jgi:hypothetical protein
LTFLKFDKEFLNTLKYNIKKWGASRVSSSVMCSR